MQFSTTTLATFFLAGLAAASPAKRTGYVTLEFWAAADNTYTLTVPLDGSETWVDSDLSFTSISSWSPDADSVCNVYGVDGSDTVLHGSADDVPIGPPQVQTYAVCVS